MGMGVVVVLVVRCDVVQGIVYSIYREVGG